MKERPILFSGPMVRAILDGSKTQTRRIAKAPDGYEFYSVARMSRGFDNAPPFDLNASFMKPGSNLGEFVRCPYSDGSVGGRLWVRESWCLASDEHNGPDDRPDERPLRSDGRWCYYRATEPDVESVDGVGSPWKSSIHMPRWASRITLEVTGVRFERVQDISENDARAEGVEPRLVSHGPPALYGYALGFKDLWREINGAESWAANPWVWVVSFKMIPGGEGA